MKTILRTLSCPEDSFFLFGPRGVGKSTWLEQNLKAKVTIDLLKSDDFLALSNRPSRLENYCENLKEQDWIVIDEVQKIPALLDEVHRLIEKRKLRFALSGSSARKLRRSGANLLAGRAIQTYLFPMSLAELKNSNIKEIVQWGTLPRVWDKPTLKYEYLTSYVNTYLKEEIKEEGLVRKLEPFSRFLEVAGIFNTQIMNIENIAREAHLSRTSTERYFEILEDTLIGQTVPSFSLGLRSKELLHPKFYFFDAGVARAVAHHLREDDPEILGKAFESIVYQEIRAFISYQKLDWKIHYYRSADGLEIDFVIVTRSKTISRPAEGIVIECKYAKKLDSRWAKPMKEAFHSKKLKVKKAYLVYSGPTLPAQDQIEIINILDLDKSLKKV